MGVLGARRWVSYFLLVAGLVAFSYNMWLANDVPPKLHFLVIRHRNLRLGVLKPPIPLSGPNLDALVLIG